MDKMLVVVFDDEAKAYEGSRALADLHRDGSVEVYGAAVIARDSAGKVVVKDEADEGPIGTAVGMMVGALVGAFGGPAGVAVGMASGGLLGSAADLANADVGLDFLEEVGQQLEPGKAALVAEIDETWVTPVDSRMEELGGSVLRRARVDVEDAQFERDIVATEAELAAMRAEYDEAVGETKEKLKAKVNAAQDKLDSAKARAKAKAEAIEREGDAKVKAFEERMASAGEEAKTKLQQRAAEVKSAHQKRVAALKEAWNSPSSATFRT